MVLTYRRSPDAPKPNLKPQQEQNLPLSNPLPQPTQPLTYSQRQQLTQQHLQALHAGIPAPPNNPSPSTNNPQSAHPDSVPTSASQPQFPVLHHVFAPPPSSTDSNPAVNHTTDFERAAGQAYVFGCFMCASFQFVLHCIEWVMRLPMQPQIQRHRTGREKLWQERRWIRTRRLPAYLISSILRSTTKRIVRLKWAPT